MNERGILVVALTLLAGGCASTAPAPEPSVPAPSAPVEARDGPAGSRPAADEGGFAPSAPAPDGSAVVALRRDADRHVEAGKLARAAALLERALRIEPRNPELWQRLAQVRLQQGRYALAESLALKSNALSRDDAALRAGNWRIIAQARRAQGDRQGAEEARRRSGMPMR